jgi:hypothetical protein
VLVLVGVIVLVLVGELVFIFVLVWWCRRGFGGRWHWRTATPKQPEERGTNFAQRVVVFGRSVARAGSDHPVAAAAGESG